MRIRAAAPSAFRRVLIGLRGQVQFGKEVADHRPPPWPNGSPTVCHLALSWHARGTKEFVAQVALMNCEAMTGAVDQ
jgi:hypothetical protein